MEQKEVQSRFELILCKLLRGKDDSPVLRNGIEDLLLKDYGWKDGSFGFNVSIHGFQKLIEELGKMLQVVRSSQV